ncbi:MAG: NAD(P)H-hydrate dehydratase [Acidobacteria bacterium]|nr:NAD(P)H-hydrate dehydratase [Acidobacteriota bacterium]
MRILDVAGSREIDRVATEEYGIPGLVLMENAALGVVDALCEAYAEAERVVILCGPGNNGGDGLAVARHLELRGFAVDVLLVGGRELAGDAALQESVCRRQGVAIERVVTATALPDGSRNWDLAVDALFGVGLDRPLEGVYAAAVEWLNALGVPTLAVDLPSGLAGDSSRLVGPHVEADLTVTFETPKPAHVLPPAMSAVGGLVVAGLGVPAAIVAGVPGDLRLVTEELAGEWLPRRAPSAHKGAYGHVLIAAGSRGMSGAAVLAARGAVRGGAGLVTSAVPASLVGTVDAASLESMTLALPAGPSGAFAAVAAGELIEAAASRDVLALGPGLGDDAADFVFEVVSGAALPLVIDASAITALAGRSSLIRARTSATVITPHPGELAQLLGVETRAVVEDRIGYVREAVRATGATVLLKGQATLVAEPDGGIWINTTGNPGMATGGTGDVLTGLVAAFWAQGLAAARAAALAAYVHGLAGDMAVEMTGETALAAADLLPQLPRALQRVEQT